MNKKILIVRGDQQEANTLSFLLSGSGFQTSSHYCAETALQVAEKERFDLAITDRRLPENESELQLVENLKKAQPTLPVILLSQSKSLDEIIHCIRSGVSDIVEGADDLGHVVKSACRYLAQNEEEISEAELEEVDKILESLGSGKNGAGSSDGIESAESQASLAKAEQQIKELSSKLKEAEGRKERAEAILKGIQENEDREGSGNASNLEREADLDDREKELEEREARLAKQKADIEVQLADLDVKSFEIQESAEKSDQGYTQKLEEEIDALKCEIQEIQASAAKRRLELEKQIKDAKANGGSTEASAASEEFAQELQDLKDEVSEKDFLIQQRDAEVEKLKQMQDAPHPELEHVEEEKRLLEVEKFKLEEKKDALDEELKALEKERDKMQREITVEKRDAEVSLRELQNQIKEAQLKMQVDEANFKEEQRQFDQAKQNFQEDVSDLQRQQMELKEFEEELKRMKKTMQNGSEAALPQAPDSMKEPILTPEEKAKAAENKDDVKTWTKPPMSKKGNRGPLRIGRKASS